MLYYIILLLLIIIILFSFFNAYTEESIKIESFVNSEISRKKQEILEQLDENLPQEYKYEINEKLKKYFTGFKPILKNFFTSDRKYKCSFQNSPPVSNIPLTRTIIDKQYNTVFKLDTTTCSPGTNDDRCNKNDNYDMKFNLFYENNPYIDYSLDRNKTFLHLEDGRDYTDFSLVTQDDINHTFKERYQICTPTERKYNLDGHYYENFPCGALVCSPTTAEEQTLDENSNYVEIDYSEPTQNAQKYYNEIMRSEHQYNIDKILNGEKFKYWVNMLTQSQNNNKKIIDTKDISSQMLRPIDLSINNIVTHEYSLYEEPEKFFETL